MSRSWPGGGSGTGCGTGEHAARLRHTFVRVDGGRGCDGHCPFAASCPHSAPTVGGGLTHCKLALNPAMAMALLVMPCSASLFWQSWVGACAHPFAFGRIALRPHATRLRQTATVGTAAGAGASTAAGASATPASTAAGASAAPAGPGPARHDYRCRCRRLCTLFLTCVSRSFCFLFCRHMK